MNRPPIYQFNTNLEIIAEYKSLSEVERITGMYARTVSSAMTKHRLCQKKWYFSRKKDFVPLKWMNEKKGKQFSVVVSQEIWDKMLLLIGQRNKQNIFRGLLAEWIEKEEQKIALNSQ